MTFVYDNIASSAAVTFHVEVDGVLAPETQRVVQSQKRVQLKVPSVPEGGATYRVVTDTGHSWTYEVAGQTCLPSWRWTELYAKGDRVTYDEQHYVAKARNIAVLPTIGKGYWKLEKGGSDD